MYPSSINHRNIETVWARLDELAIFFDNDLKHIMIYALVACNIVSTQLNSTRFLICIMIIAAAVAGRERSRSILGCARGLGFEQSIYFYVRSLMEKLSDGELAKSQVCLVMARSSSSVQFLSVWLAFAFIIVTLNKQQTKWPLNGKQLIERRRTKKEISGSTRFEWMFEQASARASVNELMTVTVLCSGRRY